MSASGVRSSWLTLAKDCVVSVSSSFERNHLDAALVPARPTEVIAGAGDSGYERPFSGQGVVGQSAAGGLGEPMGEAARAGASPSRRTPVTSSRGQGCERCVVRSDDYDIGDEATIRSAGDGVYALVVTGLWGRHEH